MRESGSTEAEASLRPREYKSVVTDRVTNYYTGKSSHDLKQNPEATDM